MHTADDSRRVSTYQIELLDGTDEVRLALLSVLEVGGVCAGWGRTENDEKGVRGGKNNIGVNDTELRI